MKGAGQGFAFSNSTEDSLFTELSNFPAGSHHLANTMSSMSIENGFEPDHLGGVFSWYAIGPNLFVNIGGSHGGLSIVLAHVEGV